MGQKINPIGFRLGVLNGWRSNWFSQRDFAGYLDEDRAVRDHITNKLSHAGLSSIHLKKDQTKLTVNIFTARPGIVIGKSGSEVNALRRELNRLTGKQIQVNINEIKRPELDAKLVAQSIAEQLENRVSFRRAMKRALTSAMRSGAQGVKVQCGGRLGGTEMSRSEHYSDGRVPLHTLRADIDYGFHEAKTTFGRIGVKVWINRGEVLPEGVTDSRGRTDLDAAPPPRRPRRERRDGGGRGRRRRRRRPRRPRRSRRRERRGRWRLMLMPKRTKYRKSHRGRRRGLSKGNHEVHFGEYGLKALEPAWITNRQIEAARIAMTRRIKRGGKVWINLFPQLPVTKKPAETRMGSGKGVARDLGGRREAGEGDVRAVGGARAAGARRHAPRGATSSRSAASS